jgi:ABC-2 type transport system permease protein
MNILFHELKSNFKPLIIWGVCLSVFFALAMTEFSAYYDNPDMAAVINELPESLLQAFSMDAVNLTSLTGYSSVVFTYMYLAMGIYSALLGSSMLSKEERDRTVEFLYVMPVSRVKIITIKIISSLLMCILMLGIFSLGVYVAVQPYSPDAEFWDFYKLSMGTMFLFQMIFLSFGFLVSSLMKQFRRTGSVALGFLMVTYFTSIICNLTDKVENLKYFTPFQYFKPTDLLNNNSIDSIYLCITATIIIISFAITFIIYPKRNLQH